jgi:hypothetical protein
MTVVTTDSAMKRQALPANPIALDCAAHGTASEKPARATPMSEKSYLAQEMMMMLKFKVDQLPLLDPNLVVMAALEAAAWIAAEESAAHAKLTLGDSVSAMDRLDDYAKLFSRRAMRDLSDNYDKW